MLTRVLGTAEVVQCVNSNEVRKDRLRPFCPSPESTRYERDGGAELKTDRYLLFVLLLFLKR